MHSAQAYSKRWRDVSLPDPAGATLRVRETWVRDASDTPKSEKSERTLALDDVLADELFQHRARSSFQWDDERVSCHRRTGGPLDHERYAVTLGSRSRGRRWSARCGPSTT